MPRRCSGSSPVEVEPVIIENGSLYLKVAAPALFVLGLINDTRTALPAIGSEVLPLFSSVIELIGKILCGRPLSSRASSTLPSVSASR
ncbi:MAG: hypothetical protein V8S54_02865 [Lachnospiraceae bacterium]